MTDSGKAIDPRASALDGKSLAPEPERGHCIGFDAIYRCGPKSDYPAGLIACPSRIENKHWCVMTRLEEELRSKEVRHDRLRDLWSVGERSADMWDWIEDLATTCITLRARIAVERAKHLALYEKSVRQQLKDTNASNARSKLGPWEFTLTYSPEKHGWSRDEAQDHMRAAIERLTRYYREEIEEFHAVGELTQSGQPHVHAWYRLDGGRKMTTKSFRRAYPIWNEKVKLGRGFEGGHHEPVKRASDFAGYVEKHLETSWLQVDISNGPTEEANGAEASGGGSPASSRSASSHRAAPESHDG